MSTSSVTRRGKFSKLSKNTGMMGWWRNFTTYLEVLTKKQPNRQATGRENCALRTCYKNWRARWTMGMVTGKAYDLVGGKWSVVELWGGPRGPGPPERPGGPLETPGLRGYKEKKISRLAIARHIFRPPHKLCYNSTTALNCCKVKFAWNFASFFVFRRH